MTLLKETQSKYWAHLKREKEKETIYSANTLKTSNKCTTGNKCCIVILKNVILH